MRLVGAAASDERQVGLRFGQLHGWRESRQVVPTRSFNVVLSDLIAQNRELWDKTQRHRQHIRGG
jgi:hypothetical protein